MSRIVLCVTSGRGPVECRHAVTRVVHSLCEEATLRELQVSTENYGGHAASAIISISGAGADVFARSWVGTIQWTSKSNDRKGTSRKNWFVAVKLMATPQQSPKLAGVKFETLRAGGPGGQHQNKTESAIRATHVATGTTVVVRDTRSQHRNRAIAVDRLQQLMETINERHQSREASKAWLEKIDVERGRPIRIYEGPDFILRQRA